MLILQISRQQMGNVSVDEPWTVCWSVRHHSVCLHLVLLALTNRDDGRWDPPGRDGVPAVYERPHSQLALRPRILSSRHSDHQPRPWTPFFFSLRVFSLDSGESQPKEWHCSWELQFWRDALRCGRLQSARVWARRLHAAGHVHPQRYVAR